MKRIFRTLALVTMVALVTVSCKKNEQKAEFDINFGEVQGLQAGPDIFGTKAYVDPQGTFRWNTGDQVMIYNLDENSDQSVCELYAADGNVNGQTIAHFTGPSLGAKKSYGYFVFYGPEKAAGDVNGNNNTETFTVSGTQTYDPAYNMDKNALVLACTTYEADGHAGNFTLQHIFGMFNVGIGSLVGNKTVTSIEVIDNAWNLTGKVEINLPKVDAQEFTRLMNLCYDTDGGQSYLNELSDYLHRIGYHAYGDSEQGQSKSIVLNCGNEPIGAYWKYFYMSLRPGALYKGFTLKITTNDSTIEVPVSADRRWLIKPATFRNIYICLDNSTAGYTVYKDWQD